MSIAYDGLIKAHMHRPASNSVSIVNHLPQMTSNAIRMLRHNASIL
jgi:hypothetical protein